VVGPVAAGLLVGAVGGAQALWLAAALFASAALITNLMLADPSREPADPSQTEVAGYLAQLRQGAAFLRNDGLLRAIVAMVMATNLLDQAFVAVLLPVWATASGHGAETVGLLVGAFGATSIGAAVVAAAFGERLPRRIVYMIGYLVGGIPRFAAMALGLPLWAVLLSFAVGGAGSGFINPIIGAVSYERIPTPLLGRVRTLTAALGWSGIPFGGLFGAAMISLAGVAGALWISGFCYLVAIVLPGLRPEWSNMRRPPPSAAPPPRQATATSDDAGEHHRGGPMSVATACPGRRGGGFRPRTP
jgi:hypothetical protein